MTVVAAVAASGAGRGPLSRPLARAFFERPVDELAIALLGCRFVRRWPDGFRVHGTWSHGDVPDVSSASAPLRAILFLEQSPQNENVPLTDRKLVWQRLLATLIRPMVTADWWHKEMDVLEGIVDEVPCFTMRFDRSGAIVPELEKLTR